ncbi:MAG: MFS transporter [Proteobacteria bacterium]|nr:MAG: MFS transporter [Pseudomonadota bacterium]
MERVFKNQWIACLSCGLFSTSQALLFVLYPVLAEKLGLSISQVILCFSVGSFLFLWGAPYWSLRSDREGRNRVLFKTQIGVLISLLVLGFLLLPLSIHTQLNFVILLASRILYGALASGLVPVSQAHILDHASEKQKAKAATTHSLFLNTGRFLGPLLALSLAFITPLQLVGILALAFVGLVALQSRTLDTQEPQGVTDKKMRLHHIWPDSRDKQGIAALAFLTTIFLGILQSSLGAYLHFAFAFTAVEASQWMAKLLIVGAVSTVLVQLLIRSKLKDPWQGTLPFGAGMLLFGLLVLLLWPSIISLYIAVIFMSFGVATLTPAYMSAMSLLSGREQGKSAGVLSIAHTLGYAVGGGISAMGLWISERGPFLVAIAVALLIFATLPAIYTGRKSLSQVRDTQHAQ